MKNIQPLGDIILVQIIKKKMSEGGIIMPADANSSFSRAKVIKAGTSKEMPVQEGDIVVISKESRSMEYEDGLHFINSKTIFAIESPKEEAGE